MIRFDTINYLPDKKMSGKVVFDKNGCFGYYLKDGTCFCIGEEIAKLLDQNPIVDLPTGMTFTPNDKTLPIERLEELRKLFTTDDMVKLREAGVV
jgi:hypothetical protein